MEKAQQIIQSYADNTTARARGPLFLYYASHAVHTPMEVPQPNLDRFLPIKELTLPGQGYAALVTVLDEAVGNLTATLRSAGLWEHSLVVFQSDNGVRQRSPFFRSLVPSADEHQTVPRGRSTMTTGAIRASARRLFGPG